MGQSPQPASGARLREALIAGRAPESGWPYYQGKSPRIEPSAWGLLALEATPIDDANANRAAAESAAFLVRCQRAEGLLIEHPDLPPNLTANAVGALALIGHAQALAARGDVDAADALYAAVSRLAAGLVSVKGIAVDDPDPRQDNTLQGWPWLPETFSWVEPTAWCVLALKRWLRTGQAGAAVGVAAGVAAGASARIAEAERLLANRQCDPGGWNYGNASAVGQELRPYVPTTAIGVLALQDRPGDTLTRATTFLYDARLREHSGQALALTALALRRVGLDATDVEAALDLNAERMLRLGNLHVTALAILALSADLHRVEALSV